MINYGCPMPYCHGALFAESFEAEKKFFYELKCLMCSRLWTPNTMSQILDAHKEQDCCGAETIARIKRQLYASYVKEVRIMGKLLT